jgi:hypothetical protein
MEHGAHAGRSDTDAGYCEACMFQEFPSLKLVVRVIRGHLSFSGLSGLPEFLPQAETGGTDIWHSQREYGAGTKITQGSLYWGRANDQSSNLLKKL